MEDFCKSIDGLKDLGRNECSIHIQAIGSYCVNMLEDTSRPFASEVFSVKFWTLGLWRGIFNILTRLQFTTRSLAPYKVKDIKIKFGVNECRNLLIDVFRSYSEMINCNNYKDFWQGFLVFTLYGIIFMFALVATFYLLRRKPPAKVVTMKPDPYEGDVRLFDNLVSKTMFERTGSKKESRRCRQHVKAEAAKLQGNKTHMYPEKPSIRTYLGLSEVADRILNAFGSNSRISESEQYKVNKNPLHLNNQMHFCCLFESDKDSDKESDISDKDSLVRVKKIKERKSSSLGFSVSSFSLNESPMSSKTSMEVSLKPSKTASSIIEGSLKERGLCNHDILDFEEKFSEKALNLQRSPPRTPPRSPQSSSSLLLPARVPSRISTKIPSQIPVKKPSRSFSSTPATPTKRRSANNRPVSLASKPVNTIRSRRI